MAELNDAEAVVLRTVRRECRFGDPVARHELGRRLAGHVGASVLNQALQSLIESGLVRRPSRGFYMPTEEES
jgi:hypothetical protein